MQKYLLVTGIVLGVSISTMAQKSRVISANNLLESENFQEAKEAIDLAVINPKTADWHRTYLVKGLLCQNAFEAGFEKEDEKKKKGGGSQKKKTSPPKKKYPRKRKLA